MGIEAGEGGAVAIAAIAPDAWGRVGAVFGICVGI